MTGTAAPHIIHIIRQFPIGDIAMFGIKVRCTAAYPTAPPGDVIRSPYDIFAKCTVHVVHVLEEGTNGGVDALVERHAGNGLLVEIEAVGWDALDIVRQHFRNIAHSKSAGPVAAAVSPLGENGVG